MEATEAQRHVATGSAAAGTGFAGSLSVIVVWALGQAGIHLPADVATACVVVLMTTVAVFAPRFALSKLAAGFVDVPREAAEQIAAPADHVVDAAGQVASTASKTVGEAAGAVGDVVSGLADGVLGAGAGSVSPKRPPPAQSTVRARPAQQPLLRPGQRSGAGMVDVAEARSGRHHMRQT